MKSIINSWKKCGGIKIIKRYKQTFRRRILDRYLKRYSYYFSGVVLDIGGSRRRGTFKPIKDTRWIYGDINPIESDIYLDVQNMKEIKDGIINTIKATELFEHVEDPSKGISECYRVLNKGEYMILSMPFLFPVHGDPCDYQRWTKTKLNKELKKAGFKEIMIKKMGLYFTVLADMLRVVIKSSPILYPLFPMLDIIASLDNLNYVKRSKILNKYTTGYFMIARK